MPNFATDSRVAGIDEAGRGPLAGPVVAAAVILDPVHPIVGLADSKKLSQRQREALAATINACCAAENVSCVLDASPARLDRMMKLNVPLLRAQYRFVQLDGPPLEERVLKLLE